MDMISSSKRLQKEHKLKKQQVQSSRELTKLSKLLPDDLYRAIVRQSKNVRHKQRQSNRKQSHHANHRNNYKLNADIQSTSSSSSSTSIASMSVASSTEDLSDPTSLSFEMDDEIPIWVRGEQRWISGITNDTTCAQLVEALLHNENIPGEPANVGATTADSTTKNQYVITERWRRVEQILDNKTKILKIWNAWGQTKPEVRLTLRRLDTMASKYSRNRSNHRMDDDSGQESPASMANSAIVRRKRNRSTSAWSKHTKTIHPKSSKKSIEKLMKLILEQGETIQHQLTKIREREHQLAEYEHEPRSRRYHTENDMGKNYLLETYLNDLQNVERKTDSNHSNSTANANPNNEIDKEITTPGNSDSGVNTEDITTSPDIGTTSPLTNDSSSNSIDNNNVSTQKKDTLMDTTMALTNICKRLSIREKPPKKREKISETKTLTNTSREAKLIMEHANRKEFCDKMKKRNVKAAGVAVAAKNPNDGEIDTMDKALNVNDHLAGQIELLEKVIAINKHIQHEEELMVRLNAKIRKYEFADPNLTETEMKMALERINTNIDSSTNELTKTEHEINESNKMLINKAKKFTELSKELEALESIETKPKLIKVPSHQIQIHATTKSRPERNEPNVCVPHNQPVAQVTQIPIQTLKTTPTMNRPIETDLEMAHQSNQLPNTNPESQINVPLTNQSITKQLKLPLTSNLKAGTLPNLISSALKKTTQINAKNTYCGTIPKRLPQCNPITASNINRSAVKMAEPSNGILQCSGNGTITTDTVTTTGNSNNNNNSQTFIVPDHIILSQAPLFFQKDNFNGNFMQSMDQRNINSNPNNQTKFCGKIGPKILINGLYKDSDSDTGPHHIGTLV